MDSFTHFKDFKMLLRCSACGCRLDKFQVSCLCRAELIRVFPEAARVSGVPEHRPILVSLWYERGDPTAPIDVESPAYLPAKPSTSRRVRLSPDGRSALFAYRCGHHGQRCKARYLLSAAELAGACIRRRAARELHAGIDVISAPPD